jgi:carboxyl-terminal processing protease
MSKPVALVVLPLAAAVLATVLATGPVPHAGSGTAAASSTAAAAAATAANAPAEDSRLLAEARALLLTEYYDDTLKEDALAVAAVQGMAASLNGGKADGPNVLLTPRSLAELKGDLKGEVVGIGVRIDFDKAAGMAKVESVMPGSAAEASDVRAGDRILSIDGTGFRGRELTDVAAAIRGKEGSTVKISLLRDSSVHEKQIVRRKVNYSSVEQTRFGDLGLVTIRMFNERTPAELETALQRLSAAKIGRLIVDVRENAGGLFEKSLASAELLVPRGAEIVRAVGRGGKVTKHPSRRDPLLRGVPMVVLVDAKTASSAEILAEALRVHTGAILVGARTYGKWRMESIRPLAGGYALKFTIATLQTARGQSFDGKGLSPDVEVASGSETLEASRRLADINRRVEADPQLKAAVQVARLRD